MKNAMRAARLRASKTLTIALAALMLSTGVVSLTLGAAPAGAAANAAQNVCPKSTIDVPSCGVLWGMFTPQQNYPTFESSIGRRFDIVKNYVDWAVGETFPNTAAQTLATSGNRILYFSWNAVNYQSRAKISYASIANGSWDKSVILPEAAKLKAFKGKVFIDFNHEFDNKAQQGSGTPAQYVAAYRHIHQVLAAAGVTNVVWVWVATGYVPHAATIAAGYPGSAYVDWIGYDPYNWGPCHSAAWQTPYQIFSPYYQWLQNQPDMKAKPIMLTEYASVPGSAVQAWYAGVPSALQQLPKIKAVMQWSAQTSSVCDFRLTTSSQAMAGFKTASNSPYVTGA
jgi:hypothetical protein